MIERMARAIYTAAWDSHKEVGDFDSLDFSMQGYYKRMAKYAVESLLEPDEAMLIAAVPDEDKSGAPYVVDRYVFKIHFRQMLEAALNEK